MAQPKDLITREVVDDIAKLFLIPEQRGEAIFNASVNAAKRILLASESDHELIISNVEIVRDILFSMDHLGDMTQNEVAFAYYVTGFHHAKMEEFFDVAQTPDAH